MNITAVFLLSLVTVAHLLHANTFECDNKLELVLKPEKPLQRVEVKSEAVLTCCYKRAPGLTVNHSWIVRQGQKVMSSRTYPQVMSSSPRVIMEERKERNGSEFMCQKLTLKEVQVNDIGFYQCLFNSSKHCLSTHGTYLQVYVPLKRTLDISESWKNTILTIEGVLLLLSVLIPGICQLGKTKRLTQLNRKRHKEEENIYEGLNLDDCSSVYHQIQRSQMHGPYQDVANVAEDDIKFEKP